MKRKTKHNEYEFEEGIELPHKLHVELYSSGKPRVKVVDQCTYKEPKKKSEDTSLLQRDKTKEESYLYKTEDVSGIDNVTYEGEICIVRKNKNGTYLCKVDEEQVTLTVTDDANMRLTSFSDKADNDYLITVPGVDFKKLDFGYGVMYEDSALYDFAGDFYGKAKIVNGKITSFVENFRQ